MINSETGVRVFSDAYYAARKRADESAEAMKVAAAAASVAYKSGDHAAAKAQSDAKVEAQRAMARANEAAVAELLGGLGAEAAWRQQRSGENGEEQPPKIDLHGLYVTEATHWVGEFLNHWIVQAADTTATNNIPTAANDRLVTKEFGLEVVTGAGHHSEGGEAKVRPVVEALLEERRARFERQTAVAGTETTAATTTNAAATTTTEWGVASFELTSGGGAFRILLKPLPRATTAAVASAPPLESSASSSSSGVQQGDDGTAKPTKPVPETKVKEDKPLAKGERIEARPKGISQFHPGTISSINPGSKGVTYGVAYDDGENEFSVKRIRVRRPGEKQRGALSVGTRVEAHYGGQPSRDTLFDGCIAKVNGDGTYNVEYDDGDKEASLARNLIYAQAELFPGSDDDTKGAGGAAAGGNGEATAAASAVDCVPSNGAEVGLVDEEQGLVAMFALFDKDKDGLWRLEDWDAHQEALGQRAFSSQPGGDIPTICTMLNVPCHGEGFRAATGLDALKNYYTMDDENDLQSDLRILGMLQVDGRTLVEEAQNATVVYNKDKALVVASTAKKLEVGTPVEARYRGGPEFYKGKIGHVNADGTYDISFDDGDRETSVSTLRVRLEGTKQKKKLEVGAVVEARYGKRDKLFPGKITKVNADETYEVTYNDGDVEWNVERRFISAEWS
jgi:hypothetical protein